MTPSSSSSSKLTATLVAALLWFVAAPGTLSAAPATAQGSDSCSSAQVIGGLGSFAFDNVGATTDGVNNGCGMARDVWYRWSAPSTGLFTVSTCGGTAVDSALAIYLDAGCPNGAPLACGDDQCGLQAELSFQATGGQGYLIRLGTWISAGSGGAGTMTIQSGGVVGGCVDPSPGPNVIAGNLDQAIAYGTSGAQSAYSFATTACNVGDAELLWLGSTNEHPVLGHNLYRFENGRFEQLGASWVKHGFAALQRDLCCVCIPSSSISALGVGCSDPYGASLNGLQSGLGPRGEVDPFQGAFPYPFGVATGAPPPATILDRRLQVDTADMSPALHPSAIYIAEAVYAAPDDAAAGNSYDNASYRTYTRTGSQTQGAFNLAPAGVTELGVPALDAWRSLSATVLVEEVRIPGEGAFWVASDATPVSGSPGSWRYQVAVFNMNSTRAAAGLAVPSGPSPRSLDMTFPKAHSGDLRSNAPWSAALAGDRIVWSAPQFAVDPNANAIHWGTTYSFFFETDAPPVDTSGSLFIFRPGAGPARVTIPIRGPRGSGAPETTIECATTLNSGGTDGVILPGTHSAAAQTLGLIATGLPAGSVGYVLASRQPGFSPLAGGSSGNLCLGGSIGRYVGATVRTANGAGQFDVTANLAAMPQPTGPVSVAPGETWFFQVWHRDASPMGVTSNFTASLRARF